MAEINSSTSPESNSAHAWLMDKLIEGGDIVKNPERLEGGANKGETKPKDRTKLAQALGRTALKGAAKKK
jgi:hypothetical protein